MKSGLWVVDAMTAQPVSASPRTTIRDVAVLMEHHDVGSVVIRKDRELLGIVTEADIVRRAVLEGCDPRRTAISTVMTKDIVTVKPHMDLFDVVLLMRDMEIHTLPVIDDGRVIGLVTAKDILKLQPDLFEAFVGSFELREEQEKIARMRSKQTITDDD